jgi:hypothetical protein
MISPDIKKISGKMLLQSEMLNPDLFGGEGE